MPQQPPSITLARGPLANRIAVIACAVAPNVAPRGVSDSAAATITHPYRFPNHINPIRFQVIWSVASKPARPVNKSKLNIMIMSDQQRHDFETIILRKIEKGELKIE